MTSSSNNPQQDIQTKILSELKKSSSSSSNVKSLRNVILLQLQMDKDDKTAKKSYKKAVKALEAEQKITLDSDGLMTLLGGDKSEDVEKSSKKKKKKDKKDKKKKKDKKRDKPEEENNEEEEMDSKTKKRKMNEDDHNNDQDEDEDETTTNNQEDKPDANKNKPCKGNPLGCTRLFLGNLPFAVDETSLNEFVSPAIITHIKWITDKETGKFYGSSFVEMKTAHDGAIAVTQKNGNKLMGRPIKINYAPAREGDVWPPKSKEITGNGGQAGGAGVKAMSEKPEGCVKLFMGNLSFDIDDDTIVKFFANVDAEVKAVRWLSHKDTGDFKGW